MMNWKTWLKYCVSFIGCFWAMVAIDLACGGEVDPYDYYVSFFHSNLKGEKDYKPFYYTGATFLYDDTEPASEADINASEWATYLGNTVKAADVRKAMYNLPKRVDSLLQIGYLKSNAKLPDSLANNTFLKAIVNNTGALKYYRFAKGVEKVANITNYNPWDPVPVDSVALREAGAVALKSAETEKDGFIKVRYYYQAQRLLHYGKSYAQAMAVYDKYLAAMPTDSHIKGLALALKAGEERRLGDAVKAAYLFSKVFAQYPEKRITAYQNYMYTHAQTDKVLALAANKAEKAVIYGIAGFGSPQVNTAPLKQVYNYDPSSPMVAVLLAREINKLEETYLSPKLERSSRLLYGNASNWYTPADTTEARSVKYIQQLKDFCKVLAADKNYPDANLATLSQAYLAWMQGNTDEGSDLLRTLYDVKLDEKLNDQKQIIQLLLTAQQIEVLNTVNEATLLPTLRWLQGKVRAEQKLKPTPGNDYYYTVPKPFTTTARNFYQQILAPAYLKQCDTTMAALVLLRTDEGTIFWQNQLHSNHIQALLHYKLTPPANPYMAFLTARLTPRPVNDMYELLGTTYLREHNYTAAIAAFKHVAASTLNKDHDYTVADPFIELINDYPKQYRYGQSKGYNKLQFATAMHTLEQNVITDPANTASYYYKLGAGIYNTSTYGNAWYLISYYWSAEDFGRQKENYYDDDYIKTSYAEKYFIKAAQLSKTQEFRARCIFMAAKCRQKQIIRPNWSITDNFDVLDKKYKEQLKNNFYFPELKKNYSKTAFYKKAVNECSYLKDYIRVK
ncbi:hypothetical protein KXQ82_09995 [Mucilaginibacter sp. HMF5004]|uniref:hypothetical protein n=1 Tax=Mucilaginibacter rivuli TaxID=2857527 RepID=UPI001C5E306F|nr:hypothetical protein [Mucilaginibacter rivuli]MBW4890049.1 hypothetical protein [Mucilaginibacter rivuli]